MRHRTLTPIGCFVNRFAVSAAHRKRKRVQTRFGNFVSALEAIAIRTFVNATKCRIYLLQRFRLQLDQRESDIVLNLDLAALGGVDHVPVANPLGSNVANPALHVLRKLRAATLENRPEVIEGA